MKLLASDTSDIFGVISPPPGSSFVGNNPVEGFGNLITFFIQIILFIAGLATLIYLLWGALEWIMSEGQKEKLQKAQGRMINAVIGLILIVVVFTLFSFIMGTVLGGKFGIDGNFRISLPGIGP